MIHCTYNIYASMYKQYSKQNIYNHSYLQTVFSILSSNWNLQYIFPYFWGACHTASLGRIFKLTKMSSKSIKAILNRIFFLFLCFIFQHC